jgi:hypothetical protein
MERCLKEREKEVRDEWELKLKEASIRANSELNKLMDQY